MGLQRGTGSNLGVVQKRIQLKDGTESPAKRIMK